MSQYKNGTVSVTNGSNVVTGTGTAWQTAGIDSSNIFTKEGDNVAYSIASVDSDTQLTLTANYGGSTSSGSNYGIVIDFTPSGYPLLSSGDLNTDAIYNDFVLSVDNLNNSLGNAAFIDTDNDTFTPSLSTSLGTTITEGASATYEASYRVLNNTVNLFIKCNFDDAGSSPNTGDRIAIIGAPSSIENTGMFSSGTAHLFMSMNSGNNAYYSVSMNDQVVWLTCTNVFGVVDYADDLTIQLTYEI